MVRLHDDFILQKTDKGLVHIPVNRDRTGLQVSSWTI
jgi:hypothetical protein